MSRGDLSQRAKDLSKRSFPESTTFCLHGEAEPAPRPKQQVWWWWWQQWRRCGGVLEEGRPRAGTRGAGPLPRTPKGRCGQVLKFIPLSCWVGEEKTC